jgi:hypothetical protein
MKESKKRNPAARNARRLRRLERSLAVVEAQIRQLESDGEPASGPRDPFRFWEREPLFGHAGSMEVH